MSKVLKPSLARAATGALAAALALAASAALPVRLLAAGPAEQENGALLLAVGESRVVNLPDNLSDVVIADPPPFDRARSAVIYNDVARALVGKLKYGDRPELARLCARLMAQAGAELLGADAVLVPVPLHRTRQFARRYNQSTELARALGKLTGLRVDPRLVIRRKNTRQQVGLSGDARRRNVAGAFQTSPETSSRLRGRRVIIIDDVITTGSTVKAVTRALKSGGVVHVDVLSFARVVAGRA